MDAVTDSHGPIWQGAAPIYLATLFGPGRAALLRAPERLPGALVEVLRRLVSPGAAR